jgi:hypothetical protein
MCSSTTRSQGKPSKAAKGAEAPARLEDREVGAVQQEAAVAVADHLGVVVEEVQRADIGHGGRVLGDHEGV